MSASSLRPVCLQSDLGIPYRTNLSIRQAVGKNPAVKVHVGLNKNVILLINQNSMKDDFFLARSGINLQGLLPSSLFNFMN